MSAPAKRVPHETVVRPDGRVWRFQPRWIRKVHVEHTKAGPVVLVVRTHDLERAARMAEVRWAALHPGVPQPVGEKEWRRQEVGTAPMFRIGPATGDETRSFPVVALRAPT